MINELLSFSHRLRIHFSLVGDDIIIIIIIKKSRSARLRESGIHSISPKIPAPQYQPIDRKKRKGKKVEDYSRDRAA